jgi:ribosomal protein S12 methylthiotransferase
MNKKKVSLVTLGCSKNLVDSEKLMARIEKLGYEVVHDPDQLDSDISIINTCGFIHDAKQESVDVILQHVQAKEDGLIGKLFVMGCLSERYMKYLPAEIPETDMWFGVNDLEKIVSHLETETGCDGGLIRKLTTPSHYAYLKISEGCDRTCSFCAIPMIRGKHISKPMDELVEEAVWLAKNGVKELILIAQDLTYYGRDLYRRPALAELVSKIAEIEELKWIRLHYAYPAGFPMDLISLISSEPKICRYLDIPFQHIHDDVLSKMKRNVSREQTIQLINDLRHNIPDIAIRTTLMVGHPGESVEAWEELKAFVKECRFERLGVFTYSEEEDTWGANNLKDDIPSQVKEQRLEELMALQQEISYDLNNSKIGETLMVLIDRREGEYYIGRTEYDSPDVDNEVLIPVSGKTLSPGSFYNVLITGADNFDLLGTVDQ